MEKALLREIERVLGGDIRWPAIGMALRKLHDQFVSDSPLPNYLQDRSALAAYLAYFFPASFAQVRRALAELPLLSQRPLRVLDVGCGPGPAAWAVADWANGSIEVAALDASARALETMKSIWPASNGAIATRMWNAGDALPAGPFDVIVASHALNEMGAKTESVVFALAEKLTPDGYLLLVEPALRRTGRDLLALHDRLVAAGFVARAPCLFQGACPALARPKDWCHADYPWQIPGLAARAADAAGLARESLKFSYVAFSRSGAVSGDESLFRIVSEPLPEKGKLRYFGCGPAGRHALVRLDRERSDANGRFDSIERGDIVRIGTMTTHGDGLRVGAESTVEVIK